MKLLNLLSRIELLFSGKPVRFRILFHSLSQIIFNWNSSILEMSTIVVVVLPSCSYKRTENLSCPGTLGYTSKTLKTPLQEIPTHACRTTFKMNTHVSIILTLNTFKHSMKRYNSDILFATELGYCIPCVLCIISITL